LGRGELRAFPLTRTGFSGNAGWREVEKSAAGGTNCRLAHVFLSAENHHFIGFLAMARCLLIGSEGTSEIDPSGVKPCCPPLPRLRSMPSSR
jgi:hypothetical protein